MKELRLSIQTCLILLFSSVQAQLDTGSFWFSTNSGSTGNGSIFRMDADLSNEAEVFAFPDPDPGRLPYGYPVPAVDGNFYGVTALGGSNDGGTFFRYIPHRDTVVYLHTDFGANSVGTRPFWSPVDGQNGKVYGVCFDGGANGMGTLFSYNYVQETFQVEYQFDSNIGGKMFCRPALSNDGEYLYLFCQEGGTGNKGTILKYHMQTGVMTKLFDFDGQTLYGPRLAPTLTSNNILYGITLYGGTNNNGGIFQFDLNTNTYTEISELNFANAPDNLSSSPQYINNKLYGVSWNGGEFSEGCLYEYDLVSGTGSTVHSFEISASSAIPGYYPRGELYIDSDSTLLSVFSNRFDTTTGLSTDNSSIFQFDPVSSTIKELFVFKPGYGSNARNGITKVNGDIYGMMTFGGGNNAGTMYRLNLSSGVVELIHTFKSYVNGINPEGQMLELLDGRLIGRCSRGGQFDNGTVFSFDINSNILKSIYHYQNGEESEGSDYYEHRNGKYYRQTRYNGSEQLGSIEVFDPKDTTISTAFEFKQTDSIGVGDGNNVIELADGQLLFITKRNSNLGIAGAVCKLDLQSSTCTKLLPWNGFVHGQSQIQLLQKNENEIYYLAAYNGAAGQGVLGKIDLNIDSIIVLSDFSSQANASSYGRIFFNQDSSSIYITREAGGVNTGTGAIYEYSISNSTFQSLSEPNTVDGELKWNMPYAVNDTAWMIFLSDDDQGNYKGSIAVWKGTGQSPSVIKNFTSIEADPAYAQFTRICDNFKSKADITIKTVNQNTFVVLMSAAAGDFEVSVDNGPFSSNKQVNLPNGINQIRVKNSQGCIVGKSFNITVGIEDISAPLLKLYPNPSNGQMTIESEEELSKIKVYSPEGKLVHLESRHGKKVDLDIQKLKPGLYLLQCTSATGKVASTKVLIQ